MANIQKRTSSNGEISYRVQIRIKGHPTETATFARLTEARLVIIKIDKSFYIVRLIPSFRAIKKPRIF